MSNYSAISGQERDAILAGLRLLQRDLERGCVDTDIMPLLTNDDDHPGLSPDDIDTLIEEKVNTGGLFYDECNFDAPSIPSEMLSPAISAETYPDDLAFTVQFQANRWFAEATDQEILDLAADGWSHSDVSDEVAERTSYWCSDVQRVFDYQGSLEKFGNRSMGFECAVNGEQAMAWLEQHRPGLWALIVCDQHAVRLVEATEPEIMGRWDWIEDGGRTASESSFDSIGEAALDAVRSLTLKYDPLEA